LITSKQNLLVKHVKALHQRKIREESNQYFVEGVKLVYESLKERQNVSFFLYAEDFDIESFKETYSQELNVSKFYELSRHVFDYVSDCETPQGILAVVNKSEFIMEDILKKDSFLLVFLDEVREPGNVGAIIRTIDAAGADALVLLGGCADPYSPKAVRSSMGSIFRVPVFKFQAPSEILPRIKESGTHLIVSNTHGENLFKWQGGFVKTALVIGNESRGIRDEIVEIASSIVSIPMNKKTESLNAATAAGLLVYEVFRKKEFS